MKRSQLRNYILVVLATFSVCYTSCYAISLDQSFHYTNGVKLLDSNPDSSNALGQMLIAEGNQQRDTGKIAQGYELQGRARFETSAYKESISDLKLALDLYGNVSDTLGLANCNRYLGLVKAIEGRHVEARTALVTSLEFYSALDDSSNVAYVLNDLGNLYKSLGKREQALEYYNQSFDIRRNTQDSAGIAGSLISLGLMEGEQGHLQQALEYFQNSLSISESIKNYRLVVSALNNIGSVHGSLGNYELAKQFFLTVQNSAEERSDHMNASKALNNIAMLHSLTGEFNTARNYFNQVLEYRRSIGQRDGIIKTLNNIGRTYANQMRYADALTSYKEAYALAVSSGSIPLQLDACAGLYFGYKMTGNQSKALIYHEEMALLEDSLNLYESGQQLQRLEFEQAIYADSIKKEAIERQREAAHQEEIRKSRNTRNILIGSGLIALLFAGSFYNRYKVVNRAKKEVESEKKRSDELLLNILPADVAHELKIHGRSNAKEFEDVTVLFTDFKGFTDASATMNAKDVVERLNYYFKAFDRITSSHGIEKIKTIGDAYMAAAGLPIPNKDAVVKCVKSAIEMQDFMHQNETFMPPFTMRVGLHTGPVVAGIVGENKFQYDIWGDTVNTAARMETSGEVGKVNISERTYALIKDHPDFKFESRGSIHVKGKGDVLMYFVWKARS